MMKAGIWGQLRGEEPIEEREQEPEQELTQEQEKEYEEERRRLVEEARKAPRNPLFGAPPPEGEM